VLTSNRELMAQARSSLNGKWGLAAAGTFIYLLLIWGINAIPILGFITSMFLNGVLCLGYTIFILAIVRKQTAKLSGLFSGFNRLWLSFATDLKVSIIVILWTLPFLIYGAYFLWSLFLPHIMLLIILIIFYFVLLLVYFSINTGIPILFITICVAYIMLTNDGDIYGDISRIEHYFFTAFFYFDSLFRFIHPYIVKLFFKTLCFVVSMILPFYALFRYSMVYFFIIDHTNTTSKNTLKASKQMMTGKICKMFRLYCRFSGWFLLEFVTFGIAGIWIAPYWQATLSHFYEDIKRDYYEKQAPEYAVPGNPGEVTDYTT